MYWVDGDGEWHDGNHWAAEVVDEIFRGMNRVQQQQEVAGSLLEDLEEARLLVDDIGDQLPMRANEDVGLIEQEPSVRLSDHFLDGRITTPAKAIVPPEIAA